MNQEGLKATIVEDKIPNGLLCHYTDETGLLGILDSGNIRATHIRFLNDQFEQREGVTLFETAVSRLGSDPMPLLTENLKLGRHLLQESVDVLQPYLVSFTADSEPEPPGDRLSQWRGYGSNSAGFSLGFDAQQLRAQATGLKMTGKVLANLWECIYDDNEKIAGADQLAASFLSQIEAASQKAPDLIQSIERGDEQKLITFFGHLSASFIRDYLRWIATCKHIGFKEEKEWRLVFHTHDDVTEQDSIHFRDGRFGKTPYIEIPLKLMDADSPLKRIVVGPSSNKEQRVISLRIQLAKMGIKGVTVVPSNIPYRSG